MIIIARPSKFHLFITYLHRVITNTGPHGKKCRCPKWGWYVGGCPSPGEQLHLTPELTKKLGAHGIDTEPTEYNGLLLGA